MHTAGIKDCYGNDWCDNAMQVLCSTHILNISMSVFCHLPCKNGCLLEFKNYNDHTFCSPNMQNILGMLEGKPNVKPWNNICNASMHVMPKLDEEELHQKVCPSMSAEDFAQLTAKQIGIHLEEWFQSLYKLL